MRRFCGNQIQFIRDKKGFTLTELVIVLVIIILIILLILPQLLDKIETAKMNAEIAESRTATVALQTVLTMAYEDAGTDKILNRTDIYNVRPTKLCRKEMRDLADIEMGRITHIKVGAMNEVNGFVYKTLKGSIVVFDAGVYTVTDLY